MSGGVHRGAPRRVLTSLRPSSPFVCVQAPNTDGAATMFIQKADVIAVFRPTGFPEVVARPISTIEQQFRLARRICCNRSGKDLLWVSEICPVTAEAMPRLDDRDDLRCNRVGNIQRLIGCSTIGTKIEQAKSCWAVLRGKSAFTLKNHPPTKRRFDPPLSVLGGVAIKLTRWQRRPSVGCQFLFGHRTYYDGAISSETCVVQCRAEVISAVAIIHVDETVEVSSKILDRIAVEAG